MGDIRERQGGGSDGAKRFTGVPRQHMQEPHGCHADAGDGQCGRLGGLIVGGQLRRER